jgi:replicative DNA helicase
MSAFPSAMETWKINDGFEYVQNAIEDSEPVVENVAHYRDAVRKYSIVRHATQDLKMDLTFLYNENNETTMCKFNAMTSDEVLNVINDKIMCFRDCWQDVSNDVKRFNIADGLDDLLNKFKQKSGYGYPFQSGYLTRIFGGLEAKRYYLFSGGTGVGKSRLSMGDACDIATLGYYDWHTGTWVSTGEEMPVLYISIELEQDEMQLFALAHVSGVNPHKIKHWQLTSEEEHIVMLSKKILARGKWFCKYLPEFDINDIEYTVEEYVSRYKIQYLFFDYINECMKLMASCATKIKNVSLRVDQVLFQLSQTLKTLSNRFAIPIVSGTQLVTEERGNQGKVWNQKDENDIKGSRAIAQKLDCGCIIARATDKELKALEEIINQHKLQDPSFKAPNYVYNIYKGRGSDYNRVRLWVNVDLGCYRLTDCFVTDWYGNLIKMEKIKLNFGISEIQDFVKNN